MSDKLAGLGPNQTPYPSHITDDPNLWPLMDHFAMGRADMGEVSEEASMMDPITGRALTPLGSVNMLMALRSRFPFLPIIPYPTRVITVNLNANAPTDLNIPDGVTLMILSSSAPYFISRDGNAENPIAGTQSAHSAYRPDGIPFFIGNNAQFSLIAPNAGTIVTASLYSFSELPT